MLAPDATVEERVVAVERAVRRALLDELSATRSSAARSNRRAVRAAVYES
jgi:hypothetical protein